MSKIDQNNDIGRDGDNNEFDTQKSEGANNENKNYTCGYSIGENGEYSYVYKPAGDSTKKLKKKRTLIYAVLGTIILVLLLQTVLLFMLSGNSNRQGFNGVAGIDNPQKNEFDTNTNNYQVSESDNLHNINIELNKSNGLDESKGNLTSAGQPYNSITSVATAVADCVVEITTEAVKNSSLMGQYVTTGAGSGVIITADGYIVTNHHVIDSANLITVRLTDGSTYEAKIVGSDEASDIAVIKIETDKSLLCANLGCSSDLVVGEDVIAIGNPLGSLGGTVTVGIISATDRNIMIDGEEMTLLQTNAAINPGNSGGGLFNMAGELIGIVNAKASGENIEGLGFAIPIDKAYDIILDLISHGYVRGMVDHGLTLIDATSSQTAYAYFRSREIGVYVYESKYSDEFHYGDRIVSVNDTEVTTSAQIKAILKNYNVGDTVKFTIARKDINVDINITLREYVPGSVNFN